MVCSRTQNLLSAYCDRELTGVEMLQVRNHLDSCADCRREYEGVLQVKRLFGSLNVAAPPRGFDPRILDAPSPSRRAWNSLAKRALGQLGALTAFASMRCNSLEQSLRPLSSAPNRLALSGVLAVSLTTVALLRTPQYADAVSAHVPAQVGAEESGVVFLPLNPVMETLPDEVRALQVSQTLGAENPIRPVVHPVSFHGAPARLSRFEGRPASFYPGHLQGIEPVTYLVVGDGYR